MTHNILNLAEAMSISARNPPSDEFADCIDLSGYTQADLNAFEYLARQGDRQTILIGLNNLDVQVASVITSFCHNIILENLPHLGLEAARMLTNTMNVLEIKGLVDIEPAVAGVLANHRCALYLSISGRLNSEISDELVKHNHEMFLTVAIAPDISVQEALLSSYAGYELTLRYPISSKVGNDLGFNIGNKKFEVSEFVDDAGQLWRDITVNDIDGWFSRNNERKSLLQ